MASAFNLGSGVNSLAGHVKRIEEEVRSIGRGQNPTLGKIHSLLNSEGALPGILDLIRDVNERIDDNTRNELQHEQGPLKSLAGRLITAKRTLERLQRENEQKAGAEANNQPAASSRPSTEIENECPVCKEDWKELSKAVTAVTLACGHTFCDKCVKELNLCALCKLPKVILPTDEVLKALINRFQTAMQNRKSTEKQINTEPKEKKQEQDSNRNEVDRIHRKFIEGIENQPAPGSFRAGVLQRLGMQIEIVEDREQQFDVFNNPINNLMIFLGFFALCILLKSLYDAYNPPRGFFDRFF